MVRKTREEIRRQMSTHGDAGCKVCIREKKFHLIVFVRLGSGFRLRARIDTAAKRVSTIILGTTLNDRTRSTYVPLQCFNFKTSVDQLFLQLGFVHNPPLLILH